MPTLFISHGAPDLELSRPPVASFLQRLPTLFPPPRSILCISAHWETEQPASSATERPETIHDFYGFDRALYEMEYPAPGAPALAETVREMLTAAGMTAAVEDGRGLDHGAWVPLRLMFPAADIPVTQLSVQTRMGAAHHYQIGRILSVLRQRGVLILGSGGVTHNLREVFSHTINADPTAAAAQFDQWLERSVSNQLIDDLIDYTRKAPYSSWNHPSAEHFLPLFIPLGAAGGDPGRCLHRSFTYGVLSMAAYGWGI